ncbi:hypothetical protein CDAR_556961 [Caerostris darwini]|uniref:Uncharacterized protein n=1 Tax=Caerostris darwini TaxID=1538125 RepID=A0AAV4QG91_9ARAC|nr:hypothetical protein CDAR_556961 [Caerostris darwini]
MINPKYVSGGSIDQRTARRNKGYRNVPSLFPVCPEYTSILLPNYSHKKRKKRIFSMSGCCHRNATIMLDKSYFPLRFPREAFQRFTLKFSAIVWCPNRCLLSIVSASVVLLVKKTRKHAGTPT